LTAIIKMPGADIINIGLRLSNLGYDVLRNLPFFLHSFDDLLALYNTSRRFRQIYSEFSAAYLQLIIDMPRSFLQPHPQTLTFYQSRSLNHWARVSDQNTQLLHDAVRRGPLELLRLALRHNANVYTMEHLLRIEDLHRNALKPCAEYCFFQMAAGYQLPLGSDEFHLLNMYRAQANWLIWCDLFAPDPLFLLGYQMNGEPTSSHLSNAMNPASNTEPLTSRIPPVPIYDETSQNHLLQDIPAEVITDWMRICTPAPEPGLLRYDKTLLEIMDSHLKQRFDVDPWLGPQNLENMSHALMDWESGTFFALQNCGIDTLAQCLYHPETALVELPRRIRDCIQWFRTTAELEPWVQGMRIDDHRYDWGTIYSMVWDENE
jgi:hypothetical protein